MNAQNPGSTKLRPLKLGHIFIESQRGHRRTHEFTYILIGFGKRFIKFTRISKNLTMYLVSDNRKELHADRHRALHVSAVFLG